jgi:hypothetical protein
MHDVDWIEKLLSVSRLISNHFLPDKEVSTKQEKLLF